MIHNHVALVHTILILQGEWVLGVATIGMRRPIHFSHVAELARSQSVGFRFSLATEFWKQNIILILLFFKNKLYFIQLKKKKLNFKIHK